MDLCEVAPRAGLEPATLRLTEGRRMIDRRRRRTMKILTLNELRRSHQPGSTAVNERHKARSQRVMSQFTSQSAEQSRRGFADSARLCILLAGLVFWYRVLAGFGRCLGVNGPNFGPEFRAHDQTRTPHQSGRRSHLAHGSAANHGRPSCGYFARLWRTFRSALRRPPAGHPNSTPAPGTARRRFPVTSEARRGAATERGRSSCTVARRHRR